MSKFTDILDNIDNIDNKHLLIGLTGCDAQPTELVQSLVSMNYWQNIAHGINKDGKVTNALSNEVAKENSKVFDVARLKKSTKTYS